MRYKTLGAVLAVAIVAVSCGGGGVSVDVGDDEPVLQIVTEPGFTTVEMALGNGPRFTMLGDGRLIYQGAQTLEYPGRLVPPYMIAPLDDAQVSTVIDLVDQIGLPAIEDETDDSAGATIADAATEVVTYRDSAGDHRLAVYALGIGESPSERDAALIELIETLGQFAGETTAEPYEGERVRIVAGPGNPDPEFEDVREWPLETSDLSDWGELANGWKCRVVEGPVPDVFTDATQATTWEHPDDGPMTLLVRPLHPGEPDCPA